MRSLFFVLPLALFACKPMAEKEKDKGTPAETTAAEAPVLGAFTAILGDGPADIDVTVGKPQTIATTCSDGRSDRVKMHVEASKLTISSPANSKCKITLSTPSLVAVEAVASGNFNLHGKAALTSITVNGSGDVDVETLETDRLSVKVSSSGDVRVHSLKATATTVAMLGSGDLELAGSTTSLDAKVVGSSTVKASTLVAETVKLEVTGSGSASVDATKKADVAVTGSGSAKVSGNPAERTKKLVGSGALTFE